MTFRTLMVAAMPIMLAAGLTTACTTTVERPAATATPQDIAVSRTYQSRTVRMAQSDFVFSTSVQVIKRMGFMIEHTDAQRMTLQAFKVHNGHRIVFRAAIINKGRDTLIKMDTRYYDVPAYDYDEPYETYSAIMWDYLGVELKKR